MFSYSLYKVVHLVGILMVFLGIGGLALQMIASGEKKFTFRGWALVTHGVGLLLVLVGGFGLMARIGITGAWPTWLVGKLLIWLVLGAVIGVILRKRFLARLMWPTVIFLGGLAAYLANYKPGF